MGALPAPKGFPGPLPYGASPEDNTVSQAQPEAKVSGPGFANLFFYDGGADSQKASPTALGGGAGGGFRGGGAGTPRRIERRMELG